MRSQVGFGLPNTGSLYNRIDALINIHKKINSPLTIAFSEVL